MAIDDEVLDALIDLIALERDRQLGYPQDHLHMRPEHAIENALNVIERHHDGIGPEAIVQPDDAETLGLFVDSIQALDDDE